MRALLGFARWLNPRRSTGEVASALARSLSRACGDSDVSVFLRDPAASAMVWQAQARSEEDADVSEMPLETLDEDVRGLFEGPVGSDVGAVWWPLERPSGRVGLCRVPDGRDIDENLLGLYNELVTFWFESRRDLCDKEECFESVGSLISSLHMVVLSADARIVFLSDAMASLTGHKIEDLLGKPLEQWVDRTWTQFHRSLERIWAGIPMESFEASLPGLGGLARDLVFLARRSESGTVSAVAFPVRQIEAMGRVAMQTARLSTMAQIASGLLAELEDPVTSIKVHAETLKQTLTDRWGRKGMLSQVEDILAGVGRLAKLAGDLVSYAHSFEEEPSEVSINALCEEALAICHTLVLEKKARVRTALAGVVPPLVGSAGQLRQALVNVITNALQALDREGGSIVVRSWDNRDGTIGVSIADDGIGMDEDAQQKVFDPFFSTRQSSGLGMSLVRDVVLMHGGTVEVDSEPEEGTVVTLTLPVGQRHAEALGFDGAPFEEMGTDEELDQELDVDMDLIVESKEDKSQHP